MQIPWCSGGHEYAPHYSDNIHVMLLANNYSAVGNISERNIFKVNRYNIKKGIQREPVDLIKCSLIKS